MATEVLLGMESVSNEEPHRDGNSNDCDSAEEDMEAYVSFQTASGKASVKRVKRGYAGGKPESKWMETADTCLRLSSICLRLSSICFYSDVAGINRSCGESRCGRGRRLMLVTDVVCFRWWCSSRKPVLQGAALRAMLDLCVHLCRHSCLSFGGEEKKWSRAGNGNERVEPKWSRAGIGNEEEEGEWRCAGNGNEGAEGEWRCAGNGNEGAETKCSRAVLALGMKWRRGSGAVLGMKLASGNNEP
eukprot:362607-Chlamydomonas_euryale.AAC.30